MRQRSATRYRPETRGRRWIGLGTAIVAALGWGCLEATPDPPERTQRERDSLIGQSPLPGARGVRGALRASDSAQARNARLDSIANSR